jgi:hypothetical protein
VEVEKIAEVLYNESRASGSLHGRLEYSEWVLRTKMGNASLGPCVDDGQDTTSDSQHAGPTSNSSRT